MCTKSVAGAAVGEPQSNFVAGLVNSGSADFVAAQHLVNLESKHLVNLEVQISSQVQHVANFEHSVTLDLQISWQAQHFLL